MRAKAKPVESKTLRFIQPGGAALPLIALLVLLAVNAFVVPNFLKVEVRDGRLFGAVIDIAHRATPVVLLAIGMTFVIATKGIDLSVGAIIAISGSASALILANSGSCSTAVAVGLAAGLVAGIWNGALVAYTGIQPIVATLLLMVAGRGIAQLMTDGQIITFESPQFEWMSSGSILCLPTNVYLALAVLAVAAFAARRTVMGSNIEAVGGNESAAVYSGIDSGRVKLFVYAFSGLCAALAGLIIAADIKAADASHAGLYLELDAILAVVIGGTLFTGGKFNLAGSVIGALLIQTLTTGILMKGVGVEYTLVVKAITVVVVCVIQSPPIRRGGRT